MQSITDAIKKLIASDNINSALDEFNSYVNNTGSNTEVQNKIILLKSQFKNYFHRENLGLSVKKSEKNQLFFALLQLLCQIEKESVNSESYENQEVPNKNNVTCNQGFFSRNKIPIVSSVVVVIITISFNLAFFEFIAVLLIIALSFFWDDTLG